MMKSRKKRREEQRKGEMRWKANNYPNNPFIPNDKYQIHDKRSNRRYCPCLASEVKKIIHEKNEQLIFKAKTVMRNYSCEGNECIHTIFLKVGIHVASLRIRKRRNNM